MNRHDVEAAARRLRVCRTPLLRSAWLCDRCQADVWVKLESVQPGGSFKIRGAYNALMQLRANPLFQRPARVERDAGPLT